MESSPANCPGDWCCWECFWSSLWSCWAFDRWRSPSDPISRSHHAAAKDGKGGRWLVERGQEKHEESEVSPGSLYASGLIAAGGIVGLLGIALKLLESTGRIRENAITLHLLKPGVAGNIIAVVTFLLLAVSLFIF